jgi:hypothetical protein
VVQVGKCFVTWGNVQRPLEIGRLSIKNLKLLGSTLRSRSLAQVHRLDLAMGNDGRKRGYSDHVILQSLYVLHLGGRDHRGLLDRCVVRGLEHCRHYHGFGCCGG